MNKKIPHIGFISLGCPKALVDSEKILTRLKQLGYATTNDYQKADLIIINTCGFINPAIDESLAAIDEALKINGRVIITGCLGAKPQTILEKYPNILGITGPEEFDKLVALVETHLPLTKNMPPHLLPPQGIKLTPSHYSYLKIAEGCHQQCTFCIIPQLRGPLKSRPIKDILDETKKLVDANVKELILIAQDTLAYGQDIGASLFELLDPLLKLTEDRWVRLHYLYPYPSLDKLLPYMQENKILPYIDVPLQHADPEILKAMRRPAHTEKLLKRIEKWRKACPNITLRSTFLVGFPGESEKHFKNLLDFLTEAKLDRVGAFTYSPVEGATANTFENKVAEALKETRLKELMLLQAQISAQKLKQKIGQTLPVIIDSISSTQTLGRTMGDAPEIDGQVIIEGKTNLHTGDIVPIKITNADKYDLWGSN